MKLVRVARCGLGLVLSLLGATTARGQTEKTINQQFQSWWSVNSTLRFSDHWGAVGDFHIRRNDFIQDPSFYFLRVGAHYWLTDTITLTLGYAHNWVAPAHEGWHTWTDENRIYQQIQHPSRVGSVKILHRLRNEQRWQQQVENDVLTGETAFSDRIRYLASVTIPVSRSTSAPTLVVSDEILIQFGPKIVANTFDQNRLFVGAKKGLSHRWSVDFGYMLVYQEKASGYQYDLNHTVRCFFYYVPDFRKENAVHEPASNSE